MVWKIGLGIVGFVWLAWFLDSAPRDLIFDVVFGAAIMGAVYICETQAELRKKKKGDEL